MKRPWLWIALILMALAFPATADSQIQPPAPSGFIEINLITGEQRWVPASPPRPGAPLVSPGLPGSADPVPLTHQPATPLPPGMVFAPNPFEVIDAPPR